MPLLRASNHKELKPDDLKLTYDTKDLKFESTAAVKPIESIIGQERAIKALRLGVELRSQGYNIFITGLSGTGKSTTVKRVLETINPACPIIYDYAYVNNFKDEDRPILLRFKAGKACEFKKDLTVCISFLKEHIPQILETKPFITRKKKLVTGFGNAQQKMMNEFEKKLSKDNLTLGQIKVDEMARPEIMAVVDNQPYVIQQLDELIQEKKITKAKAKTFIKKYTEYQQDLRSIYKSGLQLSQQFKEELEALEKEAVEQVVSVTFEELKKKYKDKKIRKYLNDVSEDILLSLEIFKGQKPASEQLESGIIVDYFKEYEVNIILDNSNLKKCPVIIETSPTYSNLLGSIEKFSDGSGGWFADFTRIKVGSLLRANGGYLILNAMDTFSEPGVWKALKRVLYYGLLEIQDQSSAMQLIPSILKPEPIHVDTKIILIGNNYSYSMMSAYEDDFNKIFKVKAEFDYEMKVSETTLEKYVQVIKRIIEKEKLLEFDSDAVAKIIEYSSRYAGSKKKLTARFAYISDLVREANFWAGDVKSKTVSAYHVDQAYNSGKERHGLYESKVSEMISEGTILIDTEGARIGQINGLAVYGNDTHSYGKPTRITAAVSLGNGRIINVEREAGLSGSSHNKGVLIISGYFKEKFGRNIPLSFAASLVFEQGYGKIDGDSASITEICALLSTLSEIPLKQSLAITGSVNQKGDIQPIGGVNEKIEGFFDVCNSRGLTGKQGVIIPVQNIEDLMLKDNVIEAVKKKKFHIYPVSTVEEAIGLLTGVRAGKMLKGGHYQVNTVFGCVEKCLREMRRRVKPAPPQSIKQNIKRAKSKKKK